MCTYIYTYKTMQRIHTYIHRERKRSNNIYDRHKAKGKSTSIQSLPPTLSLLPKKTIVSYVYFQNLYVNACVSV